MIDASHEIDPGSPLDKISGKRENYILHLSDLHFGTMDDAELWYSQLASDLKNELDCRNLSALIISGDIANYSVPAEYEAAKKFISDLQQEFELESRQIIMVPGNHDLNRKVSKKKGYSLMDREDVSENLQDGSYIPVDDEVIRLRNEEGYKERFTHFRDFYEDISGSPYPLEYAAQGMVYHLPEINLLILGLNSAWELDHHFKARAFIHPGSLARVLNIVRNNEKYAECLKLAVWHHPLNSPDPDRITDHGFMEQLAQNAFSIALHGHIHKADTGCFRYDMNSEGRKIEIVGAGTFGAPIREWQPGIPLQYNLLKLQSYKLIVNTRRREEPNGAWKPDARWLQGPGKDPLPRYEIPLQVRTAGNVSESNEEIATGPIDDIDVPLVFPELYQRWLRSRCSNMDIDRLRERGKVISVNLPELFISLYSNPVREKEETVTDPVEGMLREKRQVVDIENLIQQRSYLLIKGQAGSGKTTLLRHFCLTLLKKQPGESDLLPVLIFLKDCKRYDIDAYPTPSAKNAEKILLYNFEQTQNGLDLDTVQQYCRAGKAIFLFDGLDEIDHARRDIIVQSFADFQDHYEGCNVVFSGRPHGFEGVVIERFGDRLAEILPLTMEQVELFVNKWFRTIMETNEGTCNRTAGSMISEMKAHPAVDALKDTPLMLTAICLLYLDNNELPGQRAELYKKFIEYLAYRRFNDPEKVLGYLKKLAWTMHTGKVRNINRNDAINLLNEFFPAQEEESPQNHFSRLQKEFDRIEPDSGLLRFENGMYEYWHLTFQEFLTASALADSVRADFSKAIQDYWEDDWWHEVVELYVGYLSIQNAGLANEIARKVIAGEDKPPYTKWRLASRALYSIHADRRDREAVKLATKQLRGIITSDARPEDRLDAGQLLGRLGDTRNLQEFIQVAGGEYIFEDVKETIHPFEIAKYPVTNSWYAEFIKAEGYKKDKYWSKEGKRWLAATGNGEPRYWQERKWNCANAPVVGVSWYEAFAFVQWLSEIDDDHDYFLPDEKQWQVAASGKNGWEYPWKGGWQEDHCNTMECSLGQTSPVGIFPKGGTPEGVEDLTGNVWEWTFSDYHSGKFLEDFYCDKETDVMYRQWSIIEDEKKKMLFEEKLRKMWMEKNRQMPVLRGGSWGSYRDNARCAYRLRGLQNNRFDVVGFRCARTVVK